MQVAVRPDAAAANFRVSSERNRSWICASWAIKSQRRDARCREVRAACASKAGASGKPACACADRSTLVVRREGLGTEGWIFRIG